MEKLYRVELNRNGAPDFSTAVEVDPTDKWIACSERLPELGECVLATVLMFDDYRDIGIYSRQWTFDHSEIRWFSDDEYGQLFDCDVVAWMPLPEPWKGVDDEHDK